MSGSRAVPWRDPNVTGFPPLSGGERLAASTSVTDSPSDRQTWPQLPRQRIHTAASKDLPEGLSAAPHEATLELCALAYLEQELRDDVVRDFGKRPHQSWAPCYAIDLVALLQHTTRATRIVMVRDWFLTAVLLATITLTSLVLFGPRPVGLAGVSLVVVAAGAVRAALIRKKTTVRGVLRRMVGHTSQQWTRSMRRVALMLAVTAVGVVFVLQHSAGRMCALIIGGGFASAYLIVVGASAVAHVLAARVRFGAAALRLRNDPLHPVLRQRALDVTSGNVLVYTRGRASGELGPFVGAGHRLTNWRSPLVDVSHRGQDADVSEEMVQPSAEFDLIDLHRKLRASAESLGLPKLRCEHRLYVDGRALTRSGGAPAAKLLAKSPFGPPMTSVSEEEVLAKIAEPLEYERGYLCLQVTDWNGDVVVTMFVRAVLERELLHLECSVHALPEVIWQRRDKDDDPVERYLLGSIGVASGQIARTEVITHPWTAFWKGARAGARIYRRTLPIAALHTVRLAALPLTRRLRRRRHQVDRMHGVPFDFGADISFRERLALGQRMHYNAFIDALAHMQRLQYRLANSMAEYLKSCGIEPQDFVERSMVVVNNIFNDLKAGAITFGANSTATGTVSSQPPASTGN